MAEPWELYAPPPDQQQKNPWELYADPAAEKIKALDDPTTARSSVGRVASYVATGLPDLVIKAANAGLLPWDIPGTVADYFTGTKRERPQIPEIGPAVRSAIGVKDLPDGNTARNLAEGAAAALFSGGASGAGRALGAGNYGQAAGAIARDVVAPTVGSYYGGEVGSKYGGDTGALIGSLVGGAAAQTAPSIVRRLAEQRYASGARPDAADISAAAQRQDVTPSAGMLGDKGTQALERRLSGQAGSAGVIANARDTAAGQITDAANRAVEARRAIPAPTPETADIIDVANRARAGGQDVTGAVQTDLMNRIGARSPVDVSNLFADLGRVSLQTDPATAAPIKTRMGHLQDMAVQHRLVETLANGGKVDPNAPLVVPYEQFKDWRTRLGKGMQGLDPVDSRFRGQIYDTATQAMRQAAIDRGIPGALFDTAQGITTNEYRAGTMADKIASTLGTEGARGPAQFNRWWEGLTPEEQVKLAGPQRGAMSDISQLAQAHNYPTSQTGLTRSVGGQLAANAWRLISSLGLAGAAHALGIPGGEVVGATIGAAVPEGYANVRARALQSDLARRGMSGQFSPWVNPMSRDELLAALTAANVGAR